MGTLRYLAGIDNSARYEELIKTTQRSKLHCELNHRDFAKILYDEFSDKYTYSNNTWFSYNGLIWEDLNSKRCLPLENEVSNPNEPIRKLIGEEWIFV